MHFEDFELEAETLIFLNSEPRKLISTDDWLTVRYTSKQAMKSVMLFDNLNCFCYISEGTNWDDVFKDILNKMEDNFREQKESK